MIADLIKKYKLILAGFVIITSVFIYSSCSITDPTKNIALVFNTLSISTNVSVNIVDAATGSPIGSNNQSVNVNLSFSGTDASKIVSSLDEPITSLTTKFGVAAFGVTSSFTPTASSPVNVTVTASSNGYQPASMPISVSSTGSLVYTIKLTKISAPPAGSSTATPTQIQTTSSGTTSTTTTVNTSTEASSGGSAGLTIPASTTITDASGKPLSGSLTVNVTYTSGSSDISNSSLPTGLSTTVIDQGQSTAGSGYINPAGFASYTVTTSNGQLAKNFSPAITLTMTVSGSTINPSTNATIKDGDTVPIYSFDETNQVWKYETNATAASDGKGDFILTFQATHLSNWLSGWILSGGKVCTTNLTFNLVGDYSSLGINVKALGTTILSTSLTGNKKQFSFKNITVPKNTPITVEAYSLLESPITLVGSKTINDLCSTNTVSLDINQSGDRVNVACDVTAICPHKNPVMQVKPSGYDIYILSRNGAVNLGTINSGKITLYGLKNNATYTFGMIYKNVLYTQDHTVSTTSYNYNYNIADSVCNTDFK